MNSTYRALLGVLIMSVSLVGCAGIKQSDQSGFLSDYSKLEEVSNSQLYYSAGKTHLYSRFIVHPVVLLFEPGDDNPTFTKEELQELQSHFHARVIQRLSENDGYEITTKPGPGVARIRIGITDVEKSIGLLNATIYTKWTGAGIGGASAEGEMVDSVTGEQLAASIRWGGGSRVLLAGFTKMGDAKIAMNRWAKDMRATVDEAHGK